MHTGSDILILGGGVIGLAIAIELKQRGSNVTVLTRDSKEAATQAAAGMLAPQAEALPDGPFRDLGLKSLSLYPDWIQGLENIAQKSIGQSKPASKISAGYWPCGILAPQYQHPLHTDNQSQAPTMSAQRQWIEPHALNHLQPHLGADVVGAWWFPEEGQVDPPQLAHVLKTVAQVLEIEVREGVTVEAFQQSHGVITSVQTSEGAWQAEHYIMATGSWSGSLLPLPIYPIKGQLLSVQAETGLLNQVLFGPGIYIVPRKDGRIVIGATSETVGFTPHNTPAGLQTLLNRALQLYPPLKDCPIHHQWWGYRPSTPDEWPILGASHCDNLTLATGHHRNGILLAPVTAMLIADHVLGSPAPLISAFNWQRFSTPQHSLIPSLPPPLESGSEISALPSKANMPSTASTSVFTSPTTMPTLSAPTVTTFDPPSAHPIPDDTPLTIAGRTFRSRLMTGTGKYRSFDDMRHSIVASGCEIITVAVRRVQTNAPGHEGLAEALDWSKLWMLPNTAGCKTAEEAIRVARLGREMAKLLGQEDNNFVKLEVIPDAKYLLPDPIGTLEAAEQLVKEGFAVLPYINADPLLAKRLEEAGCATVMPLGSPIGSGQGIRNTANIQIIIENSQIPVVVDAGIGTPSEAAQAMEMGADALLINTAIAQASKPASMGRAMGLAAEAGRLAYLSGRIPMKAYASASSPLTGTITA